MFLKANYDAIATQWQQARHTLPEKDAALFELFASRLPNKASILDLGCGHGSPIATWLSELGHQIVGVDRSQQLLAQAKQKLPDQQWIHCELEEYSITEQYHGVVIWDSLFHLPRDYHRPILEQVFKALPEQGVVILSSGGSDEDIPAFTDYMFDIEFYYDALPMAQLVKTCEEMGFTLVKRVMVNEPDGKRDKGRLGLVLTR
ncbi:class I SAM-dependent methyltransferase [Photobacterium sanctipauli]|uniref:Class I SAM-dependent methyltransferase n=1 Tax=Photobacterium sanctipauli TaxID=1342794 RepID=A0A2T3P0M9_9GAMM|nr:class I SAM-dependent methyltransferase [Photobacterium sanctipauli]PSW22075.1 class I SAM-dependent methyltransferase [Photobacterium sanctipauli]